MSFLAEDANVTILRNGSQQLAWLGCRVCLLWESNWVKWGHQPGWSRSNCPGRAWAEPSFLLLSKGEHRKAIKDIKVKAWEYVSERKRAWKYLGRKEKNLSSWKRTFDLSEETLHLRREAGQRETSAGITSPTKVDQTTLEGIKAREVESARILPNSPATPHGVIQG